jgi:hypothetical protein
MLILQQAEANRLAPDQGEELANEVLYPIPNLSGSSSEEEENESLA